MTPTALEPVAQRVLRALYELAQLDCPAHAGVLGRAVAMRPVDVARALLVLDARGLVTADRARLTLTGLACAARIPALHLERESWIQPLRRLPAQSSAAPRRAEGGERG